MNPELEKCIQEKGLFKFSEAKYLAHDEFEEAKKDLVDAEKRLMEGSWKWATITGYYAMFHSARALLYNLGYREKTHFCLSVGLKAFYVDEGKMPIKLIENLNNARRLRERADYKGNYSKEGAELVVKSAKEFVFAAEKILTGK